MYIQKKDADQNNQHPCYFQNNLLFLIPYFLFDIPYFPFLSFSSPYLLFQPRLSSL